MGCVGAGGALAFALSEMGKPAEGLGQGSDRTWLMFRISSCEESRVLGRVKREVQGRSRG